MPPEAYALVTLFLVCSVLAGIVAVQAAARVAGGPTGRLAYVLPIGAAFAALYLVGHRLGLSVGPGVGTRTGPRPRRRRPRLLGRIGSRPGVLAGPVARDHRQPRPAPVAV